MIPRSIPPVYQTFFWKRTVRKPIKFMFHVFFPIIMHMMSSTFPQSPCLGQEIGEKSD